jgi:hypothetical protein
MRLEHHFVLVGRAGGRDSLRYERVAPPAPCPAVEVVQYGPAPIALAGRRQRAGKLRAESELAGKTELGNVTRRHLVRQAGGRGAARRHHRPELARQARKQQEQQNCERHGLHEHLAGDADGFAHRHRHCRLMDAHQRDSQQPRGDEHVRQAQQALVVEERREQREVGQKDDHCEIAQRARLEQLHPCHQDQQRRPRIDAIQCSIVEQHGQQCDEREHAAQPLRRQLPALHFDRNSQRCSAGRKQQDPGLDVTGVR